MLAIARIIKKLFALKSLAAVAAAIAFAAFVAGKGIPTLRHDWAWPIDRTAVPSFVHESIDGWVSIGLGQPNPHPTTYLIAPPIGALMWLFGPLAALALMAAIIGYVCMRSVAEASSHWNNTLPAALGIGLFALFNPWVYNEVVAGHLVMLLAYAGLIGLLTEMMRGGSASPVRLALWIALIEAQLQFFILAMVALIAFAFATRKWMPPALGAVFAIPSLIGLFAERSALLRIPYEVEWQTNQSVAPLALLSLGGYFPGYADRLGIAAVLSVWIVLALGIVGAIVARRLRAASYAMAAIVIVYVAILGVHGPFAVPYEWIIRNVRESGVFRELYDLAGVLAALVALLACAATARFRVLSYVALAAGIVLPVTLADSAPERSLDRIQLLSAPGRRGAAFYEGCVPAGLSALGITRRRRRWGRSRCTRLSRASRGAQRVLSVLSRRYGARAIRAVGGCPRVASIKCHRGRAAALAHFANARASRHGGFLAPTKNADPGGIGGALSRRRYAVDVGVRTPAHRALRRPARRVRRFLR